MANSQSYHMNIEAERTEYLHQLLHTLQKKRACFVGPTVVAIVLGILISFPIWHMWVIAAVIVGMQLSFMVAFAMAKKRRLNASLWFSLTPVLLMGAVVNLLLADYLGIIVLIYMAAILQAAVFSKKHAAVGAASVLVFIALAQIGQVYPLISPHRMSSTAWLISSVLLSALMLLQSYSAISEFTNIHLMFWKKIKGLNAQQDNVLQTVSQIEPVIEDAVGRIALISNDFVRRANEQATAITQMDAIVNQTTQTSSRTAQTAVETRKVSDATRITLVENAQQLQQMERRFFELSKEMTFSQENITRLVNQLNRIEEILENNTSIGEHMKVLAVNAAIEAANAGEFGSGFNVVSLELREMISRTENNLDQSRKLLADMLGFSQSSATAIGTSAQSLFNNLKELKNTVVIINDSAANFEKAATQVTTIADVANEQLLGLREMSSGIRNIQKASSQLAESSTELLSAVEQIKASHQTLNDTLSSGSDN